MDELIEHFEEGGGTHICNCAAYVFEAPESCDQYTVTMIGRGIAFSNDWCMDDTYSCVIDGLVHGQQITTLDVGSTQIPLPYM